MQRLLIILITTAALSGGAAARQQQPGPARQPAATVGEFVWHDLVTDNPAACRAFYSALFGWTFEDGEGVDPGYTIIKQDGIAIGGVVTARQSADPVVAQWLTYVVVTDVDGAVETFKQAGGRVFRGPLTTRKNLRVAVVADPQGAPIGLVSGAPRRDGPAPSVPPGLHQWFWMEYLAMEPAAALAFYGQAVGFGNEVSDARENFTYYLLKTDRPRAGMFRPPWTRQTSAWLPYVRVADPKAMAARAAELGGSVVLPPAPGVRNGSLAIVLDPTGAPLALQKYPFASGVTQ